MRKIPILLIILLVMPLISCNKLRKNDANPLFNVWETPFGMPPFDQIKPDHYKEALTKAMEIQMVEIDAIVANTEVPTFKNVVLALDNSGEMYNSVSTMFGLITSAETNDDLQKIKKDLSPAMTKHGDDIYLNSDLYKRVEKVYESRTTAGLDALQQRLTEKLYKRFRLAGAHLVDTDKELLRKINEDLALVGLKYADNVLADNNSFKMVVGENDVFGLPTSVREAALTAAKNAGEEKNTYMFTLSKPSLIPFITNSNRADLRKTLYNGYLDRCNYDNETDNKSVINDLVRLRTQRAKLLGYKSHADLMLQDRMAPSPDAVYALLNDVWAPALEGAKAELTEMKALKLQEEKSYEFNSSDWWYYAEKVRKQKYDLDEEMLRPYFSLENVQSGIFYLCNRLWGLTFRPINNMPVYNAECVVYEVLDADNTHLGVLLMDFHPREGKRGGAWCGSYRSRTYVDGVKKTDPIVTIVCNFTRPSGSNPALLTLDETTTFFHEFGHAVHALCTDAPYKGLIGVERDFVELQSQIMENWALHPQMLREYAVHFSSKQVMPEHLITKIQNSAHFNQGFITVEHVASALSDMDIHTITEYKEIDVNAFEKEILNKKRGLMPEIAPRYRFPYFSHIFSGGYSAGYYSYMWAEVLDKDAFEAFVDSGDIFNKELAAAFRKNILNPGGTLDGMDMFRNFRGREPMREPLLYSRGLLERPVREVNPDVSMTDNYLRQLDADQIYIDNSGDVTTN